MSISSALESLFHILFKTSIVGIIVIGMILLALYVFQNKMIYLPDQPYRYPNQNPQGYRNPSESGLQYEDVNIITKEGIQLHGWFVKSGNKNSSQAPTIIYFHENAGNIGTRIPFMKYYSKLAHVNILLIAYRGYSYSQGIPTEEGLKSDGLAILNHIFSRDDIDKTKIFIHGRSLGGAVSIYSVANSTHKVAGIILENTFSSMGDMVDKIFPKLSKFKKYLLKNNWKSIDIIQQIHYPILFILSMKDELVPCEQMLQLYNKAINTEFKERYDIADGHHNDSWTIDHNDYFQAISRFINKCVKK